MGNVSGKPATGAVRFEGKVTDDDGKVCFACHCCACSDHSMTRGDK
jgi:hypothetical protein